MVHMAEPKKGIGKKTVGLLVAIIVIVSVGAAAIFILMPKAKFEVTSVVVTPSETFVGETVTVSAGVKNTGTADGTYKCTLVVNETELETKEVTVPAGETKTVTFEFSKATEGNYTIKVEEMTASLKVRRRGLLPTLHVGDSWKFSVKNGIIYTFNFELTAVETIDGIECYRIEVSMTPAYQGIISSMTAWSDKSTDMIRMQTAGEYSGFPYTAWIKSSYNYLQPQWPLEVGKYWKVIITTNTTTTILGSTTSNVGTETGLYKVEALEEITVPAGTFRCFKIVEYDVNNVIQQTLWYSDEVRIDIKSISQESGETRELTSYSIQP